MTEHELRMLVRQAIEFHLTGGQSQAAPDTASTLLRAHPSHVTFTLPAAADGACVIEPSVPCNHCGFCKSYGH